VGFSLTPLAQIEYYPGCDKVSKGRHIFGAEHNDADDATDGDRRYALASLT